MTQRFPPTRVRSGVSHEGAGSRQVQVKVSEIRSAPPPAVLPGGLPTRTTTLRAPVGTTAESDARTHPAPGAAPPTVTVEIGESEASRNVYWSAMLVLEEGVVPR